MIALGLYAGIQVALRDAPRRGINKDQLMNVALLAAVLGILGGRLYYVVQNNPSSYLHHPAQILAVWLGGMAFFGAIFGGGLALVISAWRWRMPLWSLLDIGALGLTLGQAIGRVGNIINGDIALTLPVMAYLLRTESTNPPREEPAAATPSSTASEAAR